MSLYKFFSNQLRTSEFKRIESVLCQWIREVSDLVILRYLEDDYDSNRRGLLLDDIEYQFENLDWEIVAEDLLNDEIPSPLFKWLEYLDSTFEEDESLGVEDLFEEFIEFLEAKNLIEILGTRYPTNILKYWKKNNPQVTVYRRSDDGSLYEITKMARTARSKVAGEVRFVKDKSEGSQWAWSDSGASERNISPDFAFNPKKVKSLAKVLRATTAGLGHTLSAYSCFTKLKSADISPDGALGGKGYVFKIADMRKAYMNAVEALSALSDTLYDEMQAPHWSAVSRQESPEERAEVEQIILDAEEIREDPQDWAEEQEEEMDEPMGKTAKLKSLQAKNFLVTRIVNKYMEWE